MKTEILFLLLCFTARSSQLTLSDCGAQARRPQFTDISVTCGTSSITLYIQFCPVLFSGYNETNLILNRIFSPSCGATVNANATPPVAVFTFPLNATNACGSLFTTTTSVGTGVFSDFSNIQVVNVSGAVRSYDPTVGTVTYNTDLKYFYSCAYPLEYLINNTQVDVSTTAIAVKDNNGTFISTLTMKLYSDAGYTQAMTIPQGGIELRTTVFVEVKATNLTGQYNVLLDRCYATISPLPSNSTYFDLFLSCITNKLTNITLNGQSQSARFNFPAFRFTEQQNQSVSTYYIHCITRLCDITSCSTFTQCPVGRKRREAEGRPAEAITDQYTITSPRISTKAEDTVSAGASSPAQQKSSSPSGLGVAVGILGFACFSAIIAAFVFYKRFR
ncbi:zona pellucida-like domain-containing protein 1 [Betta splendens]|uniref:Zona pellucida-like domain-containing protein 1 n=1 Tax=Betta splendens TaxID=158456 RepID=A0A6P7LE20_BETSP|nr:zona pellucida-like domain-containing protein 1 [Betta splendens]